MKLVAVAGVGKIEHLNLPHPSPCEDQAASPGQPSPPRTNSIQIQQPPEVTLFLGVRIEGGLIGRAHRDLRAKTGCRDGTVGARLRQIQSLPHLDDLDGFATRL